MSNYQRIKPYILDYQSRHYRLGLLLPQGYRDQLKAHAAKTGESVNGLIRRLIDAELNRDK